MFVRRASSPAASAGSVANSGSDSQWSRNVVDAVALDPGGEGLVGLASRRPLARIVDPGGAADQHEPAHDVRMGQCGVERDPGTHRVADVDPVPALADDVVGRTPQIDVDGCGVAVAGRIDGPGLGSQRQPEPGPAPMRPRSG